MYEISNKAKHLLLGKVRTKKHKHLILNK